MTIRSAYTALLFSLTLLALQGYSQALKTNHLTCEYLVNPLGIDIAKPALGWQLVSEQRDQQQSAYTIIISDNRADIDHGHAGSVGEWLYRSLLGINAGGPGFEKIIIKPQPAGDLTYASGSYRSVKGPIVSSWKKEAGRFGLQVEIPANTTAEIWLPAGNNDRITESGTTIKLLHRENGYAVIATGSGKFDFSVNRQ